MPSPQSLATLSHQSDILNPHATYPLVLSRLGLSAACWRSPFILCLVSFELPRFQYFQPKLTIQQNFFDLISIYKRVHTRRIVSYRHLPLATYPPEMNGTAAWVTDGMPTSRCNELYEFITVIIRLHNALQLSTAPGPCLRLSRWLLYVAQTTY
jgi:hypothetical protein